MTTTVKFGLDEMAEGQANAHVLYNEHLNDLCVLVNAIVLDRDLTAPPTGASEGDTYLVAATGTGDWAGHDGDMAYLYNAAWRFLEIESGYAYWVDDESIEVRAS